MDRMLRAIAGARPLDPRRPSSGAPGGPRGSARWTAAVPVLEPVNRSDELLHVRDAVDEVVEGFLEVLVELVVDLVDREAPAGHENLLGLHENEVAEALEAVVVVRDVPEEVLAHLRGEDRQQVGLHLLGLELGASGVDVLFDGVLELRYALGDCLEVLNRLSVERFDLAPELLEADAPPMIDVHGESSPSVDAVEGLRSLEHGLRRAGQRVREEAPNGRVGRGHLLLGHGVADGLLELAHGDLVHVHGLGPVEEDHQDGRLGDKVALNFISPLDAALIAVEPEVALERELLVEEALLLMANGPERSWEVER